MNSVPGPWVTDLPAPTLALPRSRRGCWVVVCTSVCSAWPHLTQGRSALPAFSRWPRKGRGVTQRRPSQQSDGWVLPCFASFPFSSDKSETQGQMGQVPPFFFYSLFSQLFSCSPRPSRLFTWLLYFSLLSVSPPTLGV